MFPCFFSLNQCLSHSWTYFLAHQYFKNFNHDISIFPFLIFLYSGDIEFVLPLTFTYLSLPSFISVSTFFCICLYVLFYLSLPPFMSISTFFFIYLSHLLYLKNDLSFLQPWFVSSFLTIMGFKIMFFHSLEFPDNWYENWLDSIFITKKQIYLQWSTSLWQGREYCSANRFISCYSTAVYSTELQHLTASYCIKYFIFYEFPFFKFNRLTLRGNHGPICRSGSYVMLPV